MEITDEVVEDQHDAIVVEEALPDCPRKAARRRAGRAAILLTLGRLHDIART